MSLEHKFPDCTGRWDPEMAWGVLYWRCDACRAGARHSAAVEKAALRENRLGDMLQWLASGGESLSPPGHE